MTPDTITIIIVGILLCALVVVFIVQIMNSRINSLERRQARLEELFWSGDRRGLRG
jgi:uncharacterized integral membrane protein